LELTKQKSTFHDDRLQTDASLISERGKTDASFLDHQGKTETDTDKKLKVDREDADRVRDETRIEADALVKRRRSNGNVQKSRTPEEKQADVTLKDQRSLDDAAVASERSKIDSVLSRERKIKESQAGSFLQRERKETDKNLTHERSNTDSYTQDSSERLKAERTSHTATKATLTTNDEFLAIVSHDLRNPIGAILSYADLILDESALSIEEAKTWAAVIKRNAQTSLRLISDIVDLERFAEGKLHMNFAPHEVSVLVAETVQSFTNAAVERKITLRALPSAKQLSIDCDSDRITQVLANLIGNALKFTPEGGSITVAVEQNKTDVRIAVKDTGPGVPAEQQKRIFDRYTQLVNNDRRGLGLGLYISTMIIEAHQGKLGVDSTPGKGSTFYFSLPVNRASNNNSGR
jgi:signal transduction histidine kinase